MGLHVRRPSAPDLPTESAAVVVTSRSLKHGPVFAEGVRSRTSNRQCSSEGRAIPVLIQFQPAGCLLDKSKECTQLRA